MEQTDKNTPLEEAWKELENDATWDNIYNFLREYLKSKDKAEK